MSSRLIGHRTPKVAQLRERIPESFASLPSCMPRVSYVELAPSPGCKSDTVVASRCRSCLPWTRSSVGLTNKTAGSYFGQRVVRDVARANKYLSSCRLTWQKTPVSVSSLVRVYTILYAYRIQVAKSLMSMNPTTRIQINQHVSISLLFSRLETYHAHVY